jgi:hypothetical protein
MVCGYGILLLINQITGLARTLKEREKTMAKFLVLLTQPGGIIWLAAFENLVDATDFADAYQMETEEEIFIVPVEYHRGAE